MKNKMLKIKKPPAIKLNNKFDVYIARYPVLEGDKLKYYIYLTGKMGSGKMGSTLFLSIFS